MTAQMVQQNDETLSLAVRILAGHCDGALSLDGQGFAGPDVSLGHRMAVVPEHLWTAGQRRQVWEMMRKYATQLSRYGIDFASIPVPTKVATDKAIGLVGDNFVLMFKYSDALVVAVKSFFPTPLRRFDVGTKTWRVSATTRDAAVMVEQFASRYGFTLDAVAEERVVALKSGRQAAAAPSVAPVAAPVKLVDVADGVFVVTFPYSESLVAAVRSLPGRSWDAARKRNTVPFKSAAAISEFAKNNGFTLTPAAKEKVFNMVALAAAMEQEAQQAHRRSVEQREALLAASWAEDANVEVPGLGGTLRPFQKAGVAYALHTERAFIADEMGLGKGGTLDTKILTPTGWTTFGAVRVGDAVIGADGQAHHVTGVYPRGVLPVFRVTFTDGSSVLCDDEHLWAVRTTNQKFIGGAYRVRSLSEIRRGGLKNTSGVNQCIIPMVQAVAFTEQAVAVEPYFLGLLLGDGGLSRSVMYSTADEELLTAVKASLPDGVKAKYAGGYDFRLSGDKSGQPNALMGALRDLGLMGNRSEAKFVPREYLFNSVAVRTAILQGLLDTDGCVRPKDNNIEFCTVSEQLAQDVQFLIRSLGGTARIRTKVTSGQLAYRMSVILPADVKPFRLSRKANIYHPRQKYPPYRAIVSVEEAGEAPVVCIAVDAVDHLYVTDDFIVTHNTCQALAAFQAFEVLSENPQGFPALVLTPASVKFNWRNEAMKWLPGRTVKVIRDVRDLDIKDADVVIVNYDIISRAAVLANLLAKKFVSICADESHMIKERTSQRTQAAISLATGKLPKKGEAGKRKVYEQVAPPVRFRLALSGTPFVNRPKEIIAQLEFLGRLEDFGGYKAFITRYCRPFTEYIRGVSVTNIDGADNLDELNERLRATCYIRRMKADVLTELPAKSVNRVAVGLDNQDEYDKAESDFLSWLRENAAQDRAFLDSIRDLPFDEQMEAIEAHVDDKEARARRAEHLTRIEALKQVAARGKLAAAYTWIDEFLATGKQLVVFATHKDIIAHLVRRYDALAITGDVAAEKRTAIVEQFQSGAVKVIVLNIQAGGVGLTLTAASDVVFLELAWTPAAHQQAEDRIHRIGQKAEAVNVWYLLANETIEEVVETMLEDKRTIVNAAANGGKTDTTKGGVSVLVDVMGAYMKRAAA